MPADMVLEVQGLNQVLGGRAVYPAPGLDLCVRPGELVGIIGPNGSGKTTLLRSLCGRLPVPAGVIRIGGIDITADPFAARRLTGAVPEPGLLPPALSGRQLLELWASAWGLDALPPETLELARRVQLADRLQDPVGTWSLGMQQKLGLLLALLSRPPLLLLDESLGSLDPLSAWQFRRELRACCEGGASALVCSHQTGQLGRDCDRVLLLIEGRWAGQWSREQLEAEAARGRDLEDLFLEVLGGAQAPPPVYSAGGRHGA
jgi:ABC-2 type transport system ATP-binding protein